MTGCRTGEAIALRWKDINPEMNQITFSESFSSHFRIRKGTKTHKSRKFTIAQLKALLQSIKPQNCLPETLVFPSPTIYCIKVIYTYNPFEVLDKRTTEVSYFT